MTLLLISFGFCIPWSLHLPLARVLYQKRKPIGIEIGSLSIWENFSYDLNLCMYVHPYICTHIHTYGLREGGGRGVGRKGNPDMATWVCSCESQTSLEEPSLLFCSSKNLKVIWFKQGTYFACNTLSPCKSSAFNIIWILSFFCADNFWCQDLLILIFMLRNMYSRVLVMTYLFSSGLKNIHFHQNHDFEKLSLPKWLTARLWWVSIIRITDPRRS